MSALAIILVLISCVLHAARDFQTKKSADKQIFVWWTSCISLIYTLPVAIYLTLKSGFPSLTGFLMATGISVVHFFYWYFYSKAYEGGDLSHVYPIIRSSPAPVFIFALLFLHEKLSPLGITGIILITIGIYAINLKSFSKKALLEPFRSFKKDRHVRYAFLALCTVTVYSLFDKVAVNFIQPIIYAFVLSFFAAIFFGFYLFKNKNRADIFSTLKNNKKAITSNAFFAATSYPVFLSALALSPVSYIASLRQIGVVFAVLIGGKFLQEKNRKIRLLAAIIIFAGALCISLGG